MITDLQGAILTRFYGHDESYSHDIDSILSYIPEMTLRYPVQGG